MPYNSIINRTDATSLIPEDVSREIVQGVAEASAIMQLARRLPNMSTNQRRMSVLSALVTAYFVTGDTGQKQTTEAAWGDKYINAEELAVIVPIPQNVLDDSNYDIWGEIRPRIVEAMGAAFDAAVIHGTNAPADWPDDLATSATAASNSVDLSSVGNTFDAIMGESGVIAKVEADGFMVNGHVAAMSMRGKLRGIKDSNGQPIFMTSMQESTRYFLDGEPMYFPRNNALNAASVLMIAGDWTQLVYAMRQDITYTLATEGVIQDASGNIVYNLFQQDMVALRAVMRVGWQVPNPINRLQQTEASRFPFAILVP